jgi:hypothetical protein
MRVSDDDLNDRFRYHPPTTQARIDAHQGVRDRARGLALWLNDHLPESREKSLALTAVQEAAMWANAAVAIHGEGPATINA